jgi:hypothetical protein
MRVSTTRPSASRPSAAPTPSRNNASDVELPAYRKPSHPLDQEATRALLELRGRYQNDIKKHNAQATKNITGTVEGVNDMLRDHAQYMERKQKKWNAGKHLEDKEEEERHMNELQAKVVETTVKLEESMRAVIDSGVAAQRIDETLEWLRSNAPGHLEDEYRTQISQRDTQRETQRQSQANEESQMDGPTPGPTPLDGFRPALTGASEMFTTRMQREKDTYTSLSRTARYARNNDYRDFKRIVHDAKYGDDGPALGHEDTWFTETGSPAPGITDSTQRGDFDDDDDIIVDKATISTRCPITYQQFKEPVTSTKCPHTFEKNAILEMIRSGPHKIGGEKAVECPVAACNQVCYFRFLLSLTPTTSAY